ncbi:GFA family protein [Leptolyngbya sp. 15MV]|nr:GFA family protein [Leptolyngbya sp. 15MV]
MNVTGGCHCGAVRFTARVPEAVELLDCNCSICSATGFLHLIVPHGDFVLESGEGALIAYRFGTGAAEHLFCATCGIKSFYQPRSHPHCWSVNFRCLDHGHGLEATTVAFDGRDWEQAHREMS